MKSFILQLYSSTASEELIDVISFVGEDESGSFGILAGHCRMMSCLKFGLAKIRYANGTIEYLALPGAVIYFENNKLNITTRNYLRSEDYKEMISALDEKLYAEEVKLQDVKTILHDLDDGLIKNLREMKRSAK